MKRFIVNVLFFSSFLLALAIGMECMLRRVPNTYAFKRSLMEEQGRHIKTLVLGSSWQSAGLLLLVSRPGLIIWLFRANGCVLTSKCSGNIRNICRSLKT